MKSELREPRLRLRLLPLAALGGGLAVAKLLVSAGWSFERIAALSPLTCPILAITDHPCPSCGLTRSVIAALSMQWQASFAFHPLGIAFAGIASVAIVTWAFWPSALRRIPVPNQRIVATMAAGYAVWGFVLR
jgi:hypothetical protein